MHASQGTTTQVASLAGGNIERLNLRGDSPTADASDDDFEMGTTRAASPPRAPGEHVSRLVPLIADAMEVAVFMDNEHLLVVGRRMRAAGQDTTPIPGPHSPESNGLSPHLAQYMYLYMVYMPRGRASCFKLVTSP